LQTQDGWCWWLSHQYSDPGPEISHVRHWLPSRLTPFFPDRTWHSGAEYDGAGAQVAARFVYTEEVTAGKMAPGQFEPARLEKTRDTYTQYLELKRKVPLEEIYTNDLLPERK